jgi:hypothetical protein
MIPHLALIVLLAAAPPVDPLGETMFAEARYADAARTFESSWSATPRPAALAWAGLSRLRAGHAAHAVHYLARALTGRAPGRPPPHRADQLALAHARTHTAAIRSSSTTLPARSRSSPDAPASTPRPCAST